MGAPLLLVPYTLSLFQATEHEDSMTICCNPLGRFLSDEQVWRVVFHSCRGKTLIIAEAVGIAQALVPGSGRGAKSAAVGHIPLNVGSTRGMEEKARTSP